MKNFLLLAWMLVSLGVYPLAQAKDIRAEQKAASEAQDAYAQARADYDSATQQVEAQEKYVAEQQARLEKLKAQQSAALTTREKTKQTMDAKEKVLNEVWGQRNK